MRDSKLSIVPMYLLQKMKQESDISQDRDMSLRGGLESLSSNDNFSKLILNITNL